MYFDSAKYSWSLGHEVGGIQLCSLEPPDSRGVPTTLVSQSPPSADTFTSAHPRPQRHPGL